MRPETKIFTFVFLVLLILIISITDIKSQVNPLNVYLSGDVNSASDTVAYPKAGMGTGSTYGSEDWTYNSPKVDLYLEFSGSQSLYAAEMNVRWDTSFVSITAEAGNLFDLYFMDTISSSAGNLKIDIASLNGNVMPILGKYLIDLKIKLLKPGYSRVFLTNTDFRYFDEINNTQIQIPLIISNGAVKFYLGDFAKSQPVISKGDGNVNFKDAAVFFQHYNSFEGDGIYRTKFDIASPGNLDYYSMPVPDGQIDFWDLVMFATGYAKQGSGQLLIKGGDMNFINQNNKINFSLGNISKEGSNIKIPLIISGDINALHGVSIGVEYDPVHYEFIELNKGEMFNREDVISAYRLQGSAIYLDAVTLRDINLGNSKEVIAGYIIFKEKSAANKKPEIGLISCEALDYNNITIKTELLQKVK